MTRIIKASEVKPGMTIRAEFLGVTHELTVSYVESARGGGGAEVRTGLGGRVYLSGRKPVTVLSEPAPPQPEEPTEFGAKVIVDGRRFLRAPEWIGDRQPWLESGKGTWCNWDDLLRLGHVQVVPDQGWTVPDTPEVPERVDEWDTWEDVPEGVVVANPELNYQYRKASGKIEAMIPIGGGVWYVTSLPLWTYPGPWTRVSDA